jgi:aminoglycoside phosphotransferase (APT) family kinase protein
MKEIQRAGFGRREGCSIPEPLAYLPSLCLLLQEKVDGQMAEEIFRHGDDASRAAAAERSARWLAQFHARAPRTGPVSPPDDYLGTKRMRTCAPEMAELDGSFTRRVDRLQDLLEDAAPSLAPSDLCAGHGAYRPDHVILCQSRTVVFDFDAHDVADPARDVARFLVALRRLALDLGSIRALDEPYEVFLKTYLAEGQPAVARNLRAFEAAACLKRARRLLARQAPRWRENTEAMLDEGLRALEQEVA